MSHISKTFTLHVILIPIFSNKEGTPKFRKEFHTIANSSPSLPFNASISHRFRLL